MSEQVEMVKESGGVLRKICCKTAGFVPSKSSTLVRAFLGQFQEFVSGFEKYSGYKKLKNSWLALFFLCTPK